MTIKTTEIATEITLRGQIEECVDFDKFLELELFENHVIVDLAAVTMARSSFFGVLLLNYRRGMLNDKHLIVCAPSPQVREMLELTSLDKVLDITDRISAARTLLLSKLIDVSEPVE